jgi:nucleoredoxin
MSTYESILGKTLLGKSGDVDTATALKGKTLGIYFSAHWCPPCKGFTPKLAEAYKAWAKDKNFEIVFVSSDRDEKAFNEYYAEMPWLALPFSDRDGKAKLSKKYKVSGIPTFVIVGEDGKTITTDGRSEIMEDPKGANFPWTPKPFSEVIGDDFVKGDKKLTKADLKGKKLGLYFSAHWCPPCRGFTPKLVETYKKLMAAGKDKEFEIIFCSSDRDQKSFDEYFGEMPWAAVPFSDRGRKAALSKMFDVSGIPAFIIIDENGKTINGNGRSAVDADPEGAEFPWSPKPVNDLSAGPGDINDLPSVCVLMEKVPAAQQEKLTAALNKSAEKSWSESKAKGEDPSMAFFTGTKGGGISDRLRDFTKVGAAEDGKPTLIILDIPSEGFYVYKKDVTEDSIESFISDYNKGSLTITPLE